LSASIRQRLLSSFCGESLKMRLVGVALCVGGLKLLHLPSPRVTSIVLARGLAPEGYGQHSLVMAAMSILALPVGSGLEQLITREGSRDLTIGLLP
jgi:O-antigen/teichoic acid export membrane protein